LFEGVSKMNADKNVLLSRLTETHSALQTIIAGIDLNQRAYTDSDWRVRDIIGHIATWDREVTKSIRAFLRDDEYVIPEMDGDETDFNAEAVIEQRGLSNQQIVADWKQARQDFIAAIDDVPAEKLSENLLYPWGDERGSVSRMIEYMIEHDEEHRNEILKVIRTP
jgi:hypothetical protein